MRETLPSTALSSELPGPWVISPSSLTGTERRRSKCYCAILVHLTRGRTHWLQIWVFVVQQARIRHSWREPIDDSRGTACRARGRNLAMSSHLSRVRIQRGTLVARRAMDGVPLLVARSGTACRAPTGETATAKNVVVDATASIRRVGLGFWRGLFCVFAAEALSEEFDEFHRRWLIGGRELDFSARSDRLASPGCLNI